MRKNHRRRFQKKNIVKYRIVITASLFVITLIITVGYAAFSTNINLTARGNISTTPGTCFTVSDNGDGTGTITDYDADTCGTKVKIPQKINNLIIIKIGDARSMESKQLFSKKNITTLILPETLTYIGSSSCRELQSENIVIPKNVKEIGHHAFAWGTLKTIVLAEGLETIGGGAFELNNLTHLVIPSTVKNLNKTIASSNLLPEEKAFIYARSETGAEDKTTLISYGNRSIEEVIIPENVKIIGTAAFVSNAGVKKITIPNNVTTIKSQAFWSLNKLEEVNIGSSVNDISSSAFLVVPNLTTININRKENSVPGAPWGATNATVNWTGTN